jgi:acetoin utilization deacetylase AcuC-like enzyme
MIGGLKLPTLVVQEGGYRNQSLGSNARAFFTGFHRACNGIKNK